MAGGSETGPESACSPHWCFGAIRREIYRTTLATIGTSISRTIAARTSHIEARTDTESDTDSHGVSDPSGHAQDGIERANRGRSRHGFLRWRLFGYLLGAA